MTRDGVFGYLCNCFWLLVPVLLLNIFLTSRLPAAYQMDVFWKQIPAVVGVPENILRGVVMVLPLAMRLGLSSQLQKLGLLLYLSGLILYCASWAVLIVLPHSAWSTSVFGFNAPAYTPILWLAGIALIGDELLVPAIPYKAWMYLSVSGLFLIFHNLHAAMVHFRNY